METEIIKLSPEIAKIIATSGIAGLSTFSREIFLLDIVVAGTTFCKEIQEIERYLEPEMNLRMVRDPKNIYDKMAIAILYEKTRIGWVPKELNLIISRLMDAGKAFFCRIEKVERINKWIKINAKIIMVE